MIWPITHVKYILTPQATFPHIPTDKGSGCMMGIGTVIHPDRGVSVSITVIIVCKSVFRKSVAPEGVFTLVGWH